MPPIETVEKLSIPDEVLRNDSANSNSVGSPSLDYSGVSSVSTPSSRHSASPEESALFRMLQEYSINIPNIYESSSSIAYYQRIAIPREQSLLDLLRHASNGEDVFTLNEVKLRVVAATISLSRIGLYCPNIRILRLDGSILTSLRDIGTSLKHLKVLHVSRCGLTNLDGTFGLTSLQELHASDNNINHLGPCAALQNLKVVNVERNCITSLNTVSFLSICPKLKELSLIDNPISRNRCYRETVLDMLPNLRMLDRKSLLKEKYEESEVEDMKSESDSLSCSVEISSLTEPNLDDFEEVSDQFDPDPDEIVDDKVPLRNLTVERPATSSGIGFRRPFSRTVSLPQRPKSAIPRSHCDDIENCNEPTFEDGLETTPSILTSGTIVCGSIGRALSKAKFSIKKGGTYFARNNFDSQNDDPLRSFHESQKPYEFLFCSLPTKLKNTEAVDTRNPRYEAVNKLLMEPFPEKPIETTPVVELEFGVTGTVDTETTALSDTPSPDEALNAAKMWRKAFALYRTRNK